MYQNNVFQVFKMTRSERQLREWEAAAESEKNCKQNFIVVIIILSLNQEKCIFMDNNTR